MQKLDERIDKELIESWYSDATKQTVETLPDFLKMLLNYHHDYGTCCHATAAASVATSWAMNHVIGLTGFQAGCVMWEYIRHWMSTGNKPHRLVDFSNMLYPQYKNAFQKTISSSTWKYLQEKAKENLNDSDSHVHPDVKAHWQSIVDGIIPFGYIIQED